MPDRKSESSTAQAPRGDERVSSARFLLAEHRGMDSGDSRPTVGCAQHHTCSILGDWGDDPRAGGFMGAPGMARCCGLILVGAVVAASGCATATLRRAPRLSEATLRRALVTVHGRTPGSAAKIAPVVAVGPNRALAVMAGASGDSEIGAAMRRRDMWLAGRAVASSLGGLGACAAGAVDEHIVSPPVKVTVSSGLVVGGRVVALDPAAGTALVEFDHGGQGAALRALFLVSKPVEPGHNFHAVPDLGVRRLTGRLLPVTTESAGAADAGAGVNETPILAVGGLAGVPSGAVLLSEAGELAGFIQAGSGVATRFLGMDFLTRGPLRAWLTGGADHVLPALAERLVPGQLLSLGGPGGRPPDSGSVEILVQRTAGLGIVVIAEGQETSFGVSLFDLNGDVDLLGLMVDPSNHMGGRRVRLPAGRYRLQVRSGVSAPAEAGWHLLAYESPAFHPRSSRSARQDNEEVAVAIAVTEIVNLISYQSRRGLRRLGTNRFARHAAATMEVVGMNPGFVAVACLDHLGHDEAAARLVAMRMVQRSLGNVESRLWEIVLRAESLDLDPQGLPGLGRHGREPGRLRAQGRAAALLLSQRHPRDQRLHGLIGEAAGEADRLIRRMALTAAGHSGSRQLAVEVCRRLRDDADPHIRSQARTMLGER